MEDDHRELVRRLFAMATEIVESAHDTAANGQSGQLAAQDYADLAHQLLLATRDITALAEAAAVIATRWADRAGPAP